MSEEKPLGSRYNDATFVAAYDILARAVGGICNIDMEEMIVQLKKRGAGQLLDQRYRQGTLNLIEQWKALRDFKEKVMGKYDENGNFVKGWGRPKPLSPPKDDKAPTATQPASAQQTTRSGRVQRLSFRDGKSRSSVPPGPAASD